MSEVRTDHNLCLKTRRLGEDIFWDNADRKKFLELAPISAFLPT